MTTAKPVEAGKTDIMLEAAQPLLDLARANIQNMRKPTDQNPDVLAGAALSMALQALVMADFSHFKPRKDVNPRAVEVGGEQLNQRFFGVGQGVGIVIATLLAENPELMAPILSTVIDGMAGGMVSRAKAGS